MLSRKVLTRTRVLGIVSTLLFLGAPFAGADVIDDFETAQATLTDTGSSVVTDDGIDVILGDHRELEIELVDGTSATVEAAAGSLSFDATAGGDSEGVATVVWDADTNTTVFDGDGLGGVNLTDNSETAFRIEIQSASADTQILLEVFTNDSNSSQAGLRLPTVVMPESFFVSYADFIPNLGTGADFANVGAIVLRILGTNVAVDISHFETVGPSLTVTKIDIDPNDDMDFGTDPVVPGDTIRYQVQITNDGGLAQQVDLADTPDGNTTFTADSLTATPVALVDTVAVLGNVTRTVADPGVLENDQDPDADALFVRITNSDTASSEGGVIAWNDAGSDDQGEGGFQYFPPAGFRGVDSFNYELEDADGQTAVGLVTVILDRVVWFVDDDHPGPFEGTLANPFADFTQLVGAGDVDGPGDIIFVFSHSGAGYDTGDASGLVLEDGQQLLGEEVGLVLGAQTVVPAGATPVLHNSAGTPGHGITLAANNTLRGFDLGDTDAGAAAIVANANVGTLTMSDVLISGSGRALHLASGGTLAVTLEGIASTASTGSPVVLLDGVGGSLVVTPNGGLETSIAGAFAGIDVRNAVAGSTFSFGDATIGTGAGHGVRVEANATAAVSFGDLDVTTTGGTGILGVTSGALLVGDAGSTINAVGGTAINVGGLDLGAGWTFASASSSGAGRGIRVASIDDPITINGGSITKSTAEHAIDVDLGNADFTYAGSVSQSGAGASVRVNGRTGGVHTFSGAVSGAMGGGVLLTSNGAAQIDFTGGVNLQTGTNVAFQATGGGTVNVTSASVVTLLAVNGATSALVLNGVAVGASDVTFDGIVADNTTANAVIVADVSGPGSFFGGVTSVTGGTGTGILVNVSPATVGFTSALITDRNAGIQLLGANGPVTLQTIDIDDTTGRAFFVSGNVNPVVVNGGAIGTTNDTGDAANEAVRVQGGAGNVTFAAAINNTVGLSVAVLSRAGGLVDFSSFIDDDGAGIIVENNDQGGVGTVRFRGGMALDTDGSRAFHALAGGVVEVCATGDCAGGAAVVNRIGAATPLSMTAVEITDTTIGANGVTFERIDVSGAESGIVLDTTGSVGAFMVSGDGSMTGGVLNRNGSGGVITNTTNDGVSLTAAHNVTLRQMNVTNCGDSTAGDDCIDSSGGSNHVLSAVHVSNATGTGANEDFGNGWRLTNITGNNRMDHGSLFTSFPTASTHAVRLRNTDTNGNLTISGSSFTNQGAGNSGTFVTAQAFGSSVVNFTTEGTRPGGVGTPSTTLFSGLRGDAILSALESSATGSMTTIIRNSDFRDAAANGSGSIAATVNQAGATHDVTIEDNIFNNLSTTLAAPVGVVTTNIATNGGNLNATIQRNDLDIIQGTRRGIQVVAQPGAGSGALNLTVDDNTIDRIPGNFGILVDVDDLIGNSTLTLTNNQIGQAAGFLGNVGEVLDGAFLVRTRGTPASTNTLTISNNNIRATTSGGGRIMFIDARDDRTSNLNVLNNTIRNDDAGAGDPEFFLRGQVGSPTVCLNLNGNNAIDNTGANGSGSYEIRQVNGTVNVEDLANVNANNQGAVSTVGTVGTAVDCIP